MCIVSSEYSIRIRRKWIEGLWHQNLSFSGPEKKKNLCSSLIHKRCIFKEQIHREYPLNIFKETGRKHDNEENEKKKKEKREARMIDLIIESPTCSCGIACQMPRNLSCTLFFSPVPVSYSFPRESVSILIYVCMYV